jgi:hypothetical protein
MTRASQISSKLEATSESVVDVCQVIGPGTLAAIAEGGLLSSMVIIHQLPPVVLGRSVEELDEELVQLLSTVLYVTLPFGTTGSLSS